MRSSPYVHVADVARSLEFYTRFGLATGRVESIEPKDGSSLPLEPRGRVYPVTYPFYMPKGECRVEDPDGYCVLIGQLDD